MANCWLFLLEAYSIQSILVRWHYTLSGPSTETLPWLAAGTLCIQGLPDGAVYYLIITIALAQAQRHVRKFNLGWVPALCDAA